MHGRRDSRVDTKEEQPRLPTDPVEQNQLWFKLSKATVDRASVDEAHYSWLLACDLTNLSFALQIMSAGLAATLRFGGWECIVLVSTQALLYAVLSRVAAIKGRASASSQRC